MYVRSQVPLFTDQRDTSPLEIRLVQKSGTKSGGTKIGGTKIAGSQPRTPAERKSGSHGRIFSVPYSSFSFFSGSYEEP
jgi:hypothetical protein